MSTLVDVEAAMHAVQPTVYYNTVNMDPPTKVILFTPPDLSVPLMVALHPDALATLRQQFPQVRFVPLFASRERPDQIDDRR